MLQYIIYYNIYVIYNIISRAGLMGTCSPTFGHAGRNVFIHFECTRCHFLSVRPPLFVSRPRSNHKIRKKHVMLLYRHVLPIMCSGQTCFISSLRYCWEGENLSALINHDRSTVAAVAVKDANEERDKEKSNLFFTLKHLCFD